jgi:hypothetical protein
LVAIRLISADRGAALAETSKSMAAFTRSAATLAATVNAAGMFFKIYHLKQSARR